MLEKLSLVVFLFLGVPNLIKADAEPKRDEFGRVVDHGVVKKYFLELYNEALTKAMRDQEEEETNDHEYSRNSEKMGFGSNSISGYSDERQSSFSNPEFHKFETPSYPSSFHKEADHGFSGFAEASGKAQVQGNKHTAHGYHGYHKHKHHKHQHEHTNDHKHAHKHLHEQSHEHKHSAKHQHMHKHEHHHEHNHHHKHKEDHEHKQDHKHGHKHLHQHKGNSWRRQGQEENNAGRREDKKEFEPINSEMQIDEDSFEQVEAPLSNFMNKLKSPNKPSISEYQDIDYDAWEQI